MVDKNSQRTRDKLHRKLIHALRRNGEYLELKEKRRRFNVEELSIPLNIVKISTNFYDEDRYPNTPSNYTYTPSEIGEHLNTIICERTEYKEWLKEQSEVFSLAKRVVQKVAKETGYPIDEQGYRTATGILRVSNF